MLGLGSLPPEMMLIRSHLEKWNFLLLWQLLLLPLELLHFTWPAESGHKHSLSPPLCLYGRKKPGRCAAVISGEACCSCVKHIPPVLLQPSALSGQKLLGHCRAVKVLQNIPDRTKVF